MDFDYSIKFVFEEQTFRNEIHDGPADPRCQNATVPERAQIQILSYILMFALTRSANNKEPRDSAVKKARQEAVLEATRCHIVFLILKIINIFSFVQRNANFKKHETAQLRGPKFGLPKREQQTGYSCEIQNFAFFNVSNQTCQKCELCMVRRIRAAKLGPSQRGQQTGYVYDFCVFVDAFGRPSAD